jgi:hypothetical protein
MTDTLDLATNYEEIRNLPPGTTATVAPRPARRPAPRRSATPPRQAPSSQPDPVLNRLDQILAQQSDLAARLEVVEKGGIRFIETEPLPKPVMREANPESVAPFTRRLLDRTHDMPENGIVNREPAYNAPLRWYLRRDGDYVKLQGDRDNRTMYEDLGFYRLTDDEVAEFEKKERPGILRDQKTRANLFNQLRKLVKREPPLSAYVDDADWDEELEGKSNEGLHQEWRRLCVKIGDPDRELPSERHRAERDPNAGLLAGVVTSREVVDLQRKLSAPGAQTRTIEVTRENAHMFS